MTFQERAKQIGKLSGRAVFKGVIIGSVIAAHGVKLVDAGLSTANDLANDFSGYKGKDIAAPIAKKAALELLDATKKFAIWGEKKLR